MRILQSARRWRRTNRKDRCPVCKHADWCLISIDGTAAICPRTESPHRCGEAGWLHRLDTPAARIARPSPTLPAGAKSERAADGDLHPVYHAALARLRLADRHRTQLRDRGLTEADIARASYRTLPAGCRAPLARELRDLFGDAWLLTVPGIIVREGRHGRYLTVAGAPGLLIPIRSAVGHIVGLVVRPDDPGDGGKYRWLSSAPAGPSPGWRVHVPAGAPPTERVVLTEGALKADVATALAHGQMIIGLPGPHVIDEAIAALHALGARRAVLALDADANRNVHVARAQLDGRRKLEAAGFVGELLRWEPTLGKGLDDMLLTLRGGHA
jgi:hypothetical protein